MNGETILQVRADPAVQAAYFGDAREASHA